ncbi:ArsR/SmtB family transcription factor [Mycetocola miduiensis]|uniref:DNA-binding transcriptional regulator, ArsR family n=1 Tax=Mycetocola miduiensis TaxID=995034 RepID=A0A1I5CRP5_9MICO|nr:helix-turn-helix transcriptional regulator [Mycetocola miduiensis]SFN89628.1 DNA-binding transcriptional regulator, ArsR family [Mycetocola miduiensis]
MARANELTDEPDIADFDFARVLAAVADPVRLSILRQLADAHTALNCGAFELPVKAPTATHHFTALRQAGVLHQYYVGSSRMNLLRFDDMEQAYPGFLPSVIAASAMHR